MNSRAGILTGLMIFGTSIGFTAQGCAVQEEDTDDSQGAATVNVSDARVMICGQDVEGCDMCLEQIGGDANTPARVLTQTERNACTMKSLRSGLRARVSYLISRAGRQGFFLRTGGSTGAVQGTNSTSAVAGTLPGTPYKLIEMRVEQVVGDPAKSSRYDYTKLGGIFTAGDPNAPQQSSTDCKDQPGSTCASASMSVYSYYMPMKFVFRFSDTSAKTADPNADDYSDDYAMNETYGFIPWLSMSGSAAVNLNIGSILSKFGAGAVGSALLASLGGQASVQVNAEKGFGWTTPVCADRNGDTSKDALDAFDRDFYRNVLTPACVQMSKDHPTLNLNCKGMEALDTRPINNADLYLLERKIQPVEACTLLDANIVSTKPARYKIAFAAPKAWGYAQGQNAYLYGLNAKTNDTWERDTGVKIIGVDTGITNEATKTQTCGNRVLKIAPPADPGALPGATPAVVEDEVCVYAEVSKSFFGSDCTALSKPGRRTFGMAQTGNGPEDKTIHYIAPAQ